MDKNGKISIRLSEEAQKKLKEATEAGWRESAFINSVIVGNQIRDYRFDRAAVTHLSRIETELEFLDDSEIKKNLRKAVRGLWQSLR